MTLEELYYRVPSVFTEGHLGSSIYEKVNTAKVIEYIQDKGWQIVEAKEQKARTETHAGFQKHMITFRKIEDTTSFRKINDDYFEIHLINSHDARCAYRLVAGIFRLVCSNGLIIAKNTFGDIRIPHIQINREQIIESLREIIYYADKAKQTIDEMQVHKLSTEQQHLFALAALQLRVPENKLDKYEFQELLKPRRKEDSGDSLWKIYNVIQENLIKGTIFQHATLRRITAIDSVININKALFEIACFQLKI